jgi:hypothetical protein
MAIGQSTFSNAGGAASDLFAGFGATTQAGLKGKGLNLQASGQRITAQGTRLNAEGLRIKASGDLAEAGEYDLAGNLATKNEKFTEQSVAIQQMQQERNTTMQIGGQRAEIAGAGGAESGSALDILRDSASQGALAKQVLGQQGLITEAGYDEQAKSYQLMASTARTTAAGEQDIANKTDVIAGQQDQIANQTDQLAAQTVQAGKDAATGDFISGAIKGVAAIASIALAPATGGLSLAATAGLDGLSAIH